MPVAGQLSHQITSLGRTARSRFSFVDVLGSALHRKLRFLQLSFNGFTEYRICIQHVTSKQIGQFPANANTKVQARARDGPSALS
jgi:hypothetical protein